MGIIFKSKDQRMMEREVRRTRRSKKFLIYTILILMVIISVLLGYSYIS